jgi:hypothetical protein
MISRPLWFADPINQLRVQATCVCINLSHAINLGGVATIRTLG